MSDIEGSFDPDPFELFGAVPAQSDPGAAAALARALAAPVGPDRLTHLTQADPRLLKTRDRIDHLTSWQEALSWVNARAELAVAAVAGPTPEPTVPEPSSKPTGNIAEDA